VTIFVRKGVSCAARLYQTISMARTKTTLKPPFKPETASLTKKVKHFKKKHREQRQRQQEIDKEIALAEIAMKVEKKNETSGGA
jgi:hypothetical protein